MCIKRFLMVPLIIFFAFVQSLFGMDKTTVDTVNLSNNEVILIFLDDQESDGMTNTATKIGLITNDFLTAFHQGAGPILVSASIIDNARLKQKPKETDTQKLIE
jgi:hypothetical protein